MKKYKMV